MKPYAYEVIEDKPTHLLIRDLSPKDRRLLTLTNAAEHVVQELAKRLKKRRLEYIDSQGFHSEIYHHKGLFVGFGPTRNLPPQS